jgi:hypothetical protein
MPNMALRFHAGRLVWPMMLAALALAGCKHATVRPAEGGSFFTFIEPPATAPESKREPSSGPLQPTEVIVAADPILPLQKPVYPAPALGRQHSPMMVGVHITVDASGRVAHVGPSLRAFTTPGPFATEFLAAVESALAEWRFTPAEKRRMRPMKSNTGEDFWLITRAEKIEYGFDLSFTFTSSGDVLPALTK